MLLYRDWYDTVRDYSHRRLTQSGDSLPALSGVAADFARGTGDSYAAGIWKAPMPCGLLWKAERSA